MNVSEAVRAMAEAAEWVWARPVGWAGCGQAFCLDAGKRMTQIVPRPRGAEMGMSAYVSDLLDEWELVAPEKVLAEGAGE